MVGRGGSAGRRSFGGWAGDDPWGSRQEELLVVEGHELDPTCGKHPPKVRNFRRALLSLDLDGVGSGLTYRRFTFL